MKVITWNTNRQYTPKGQRIAARVNEDLTVAFCDVDRGLDGVTKEPMLFHDYPVNVHVMDCYDRGAYTETSTDPELRQAALAI
jgi:hypothetical protein